MSPNTECVCVKKGTGKQVQPTGHSPHPTAEKGPSPLLPPQPCVEYTPHFPPHLFHPLQLPPPPPPPAGSVGTTVICLLGRLCLGEP